MTRPTSDRRAVVVPWLALPVGTAVLSLAHSMASRAELGAKAHFHVFWLGIFLFLLPAGWALFSARTRDLDRYLLVVALGIYSYFPKLMAYPGSPTYFDEYAHWAQTERLTRDGLLFIKNNQVVVIGDYPAMHASASAIRHLTGLSTYNVAVVLLFVLHVLTLLGLMAIGTRISGSRHVGGIAALLYCVGPGFWFFNAQFAYEAFAIVLFVWSCTSVVHMIRAESASWERTAWTISVLWISFTLVASHHLSSYANLIVLGAIAFASVFRWMLGRESRQNAGEVMLVFVTVAALTGWWFVSQAPNTKEYLEPYLKGGITDVVSLTDRVGNEAEEEEKNEPRQLFKGSTLPTYEKLLGFVSYMLVAVMFGVGVLAQWRRGLRSPGAWGMALTGLVYFLAYPLMLSASGASGASRSWSFTNVGVSVVIALAVAPGALLAGRVARTMAGIAFMGCTAVLMIGNVAVNISEYYRFPGPYVYGSDARSATNEVRDAAEWFQDTQGSDHLMIGDRGVQVAWVLKALAVPGVPSESHPIWNLVLETTPPDPQLLDRIREEQLRYVVIDRHQVTAVPRIGFYLDKNEPLAMERDEPLGDATLTKWDRLPWAIRIYSSNWIDVYRLDFDAFPEPRLPGDGMPVPGRTEGVE